MDIHYIYSDYNCNEDLSPDYSYNFTIFDLISWERKTFYKSVLFAGWLLGASYSIAVNRFQTVDEQL